MDKAEPTLLDGSAQTEGKGKGATLVDGLKNKVYPAYVTFRGQNLTDDDYITMWDYDSKSFEFLSRVQRIELTNKYFQVLDKIDWEKTNQLLELKIQQQRHEAAKQQNHAGHQLGAREFTLTYSPKWFDDTEARVLMKKAIEKLIKYYGEEVIQLRAVGEVGSNGLSHVHCFYKLRGGLKISDKNFKRAYKYWNPKKVTSRTGHEGGHHANVRIESDFQGYIDKDVDSAWLDIYFPSPDPTV